MIFLRPPQLSIQVGELHLERYWLLLVSQLQAKPCTPRQILVLPPRVAKDNSNVVLVAWWQHRESEFHYVCWKLL